MQSAVLIYTHAPGFLVFLIHRVLYLFSWCFSHCFQSTSIFLSMGTPWRLSPLPFFSLFNQCDGCMFFLLLRGGSWLDCLDLPAMGAVSIQELDVNSRSSWMSQAPSLHFPLPTLKQLLTNIKQINYYCSYPNLGPPSERSNTCLGLSSHWNLRKIFAPYKAKQKGSIQHAVQIGTLKNILKQIMIFNHYNDKKK